MQAIVYTQYGSPEVLQLQEVETPTPKAKEVLVKVHAVSVNQADLHLLGGQPFFLRLTLGLFKPRNPILGSDIAGRVEAVGRDVTRFQPGDTVFGDLSATGRGGFAEYVVAPANALALKPAGVSFEAAASVPMAGVTALQGLREHGHIQAGERVLINGASGGVGSLAVQIAKVFGAEVTAVCSTRKVEMVRKLGADRVIDYTRQDFTQTDQPYDLIFDTVANRSIADYRRAMTPTGRFITTGFLPALYLQGMRSGKQRMGNMLAKPNAEDLALIGELLDAGQLTPTIDRRYPLSEVADALRYLERGHAAGKVLIAIPQADKPTIHRLTSLTASA